jgi:iron complex transport system ATP-binding protein
MHHALELENVSAGYPGRPVLRDLSLVIRAGETVALLGPNGAGKSTLLQVMTGLRRPTAGRVRLFDRDVQQLPAAERARLVSLVPQQMEVPMAFTVEEMVMMGRTATLHRWQGPSDHDRQLVEQAMTYTDISHLRQRLFTEMSGGERQRVVIALALAAEPRLILLDEPTSHLDLNHRLEVLELISRLNCERGVAIVMVAHDLSMAAEFFPRLILLDAQGRIAADGTPATVLTGPTLEAVYHCRVTVHTDPACGALRVFPRRTRAYTQIPAPQAATTSATP